MFWQKLKCFLLGHKHPIKEGKVFDSPVCEITSLELNGYRYSFCWFVCERCHYYQKTVRYEEKEWLRIQSEALAQYEQKLLEEIQKITNSIESELDLISQPIPSGRILH